MTKTPAQAFIVYMHVRSCKCETPPATLFTTRSKQRAIDTARAHWLLYVGFYGDMVNWHDIYVVDTRDGVTIFRNGKPLKEGFSDNEPASQKGREGGDPT